MRQDIKYILYLFWKGRLPRNKSQELLDNLEDYRTNLLHEFKAEDEQNKEDTLSPIRSQEILTAIRARAQIKNTVQKRIWMKRAARVAAMFTIFGFISLIYMQMQSNRLDNSQHNALVNATLKMHHVLAHHDSVIHRLSDGSVVTLAPNSTIYYDEFYGVNHRNISLSGEATFRVYRDTSIAFVVTANGITTTALGTSFVINNRAANLISIRLLSGKVVVRSTKESKVQIKDTYLDSMGDYLAIEDGKNPSIIHSPNYSNPPVEKLKKDEPLASNSNLTFNKQSLQEVVHILSSHFSTPIILEDGATKKLTFTGAFNDDDSLRKILETICLVNDLELSATTDEGYILRAQ